MSPRSYRMAGRAAAVEATRRGIVDAAIRLHAARGSRAVNWDDLAREAGVSRATVYHHFPSLAELVPACAQVAFAAIDAPAAEAARGLFAGLPSPQDRLARLVRETCRCYGAGEPWLRAAWRERDVEPAFGDAVARLLGSLNVLLDAALEDAHVTPARRAAAAGLLDFATWDGFARAGVPREQIPDHLVRLAAAAITG